VSKYPFLSDEWIDQSRKIRDEYQGKVPEVTVTVRMNQIVQEVPFGEGVIRSHLDTSSGRVDLELGHVDNPDLTVTLTYSTAKALLVDGDANAAMNAFLSGRIKIDGDITKLLTLQGVGVSSAAAPLAVEMVKRIQEMTE